MWAYPTKQRLWIIKFKYFRDPHVSFQTTDHRLVDQTFCQGVNQDYTNDTRAILSVKNVLVVSWNKVIVQVGTYHEQNHVAYCQPQWSVKIGSVVPAIDVHLILIVVHQNSCPIERVVFETLSLANFGNSELQEVGLAYQEYTEEPTQENLRRDVKIMSIVPFISLNRTLDNNSIKQSTKSLALLERRWILLIFPSEEGDTFLSEIK